MAFQSLFWAIFGLLEPIFGLFWGVWAWILVILGLLEPVLGGLGLDLHHYGPFVGHFGPVLGDLGHFWPFGAYFEGCGPGFGPFLGFWA